MTLKLLWPSRGTFVLKEALADRLVIATAFLVVLLATTLVSAIPIYANAVAQSGLRARLDRAPVTEANLQATVHVFNGGTDVLVDRRVRTIARDVFRDTGVSIFRSGESEPFAAEGRNVVFGSFVDISHHARLVAGRWPGPGEAPVEVVVPDLVARDLRIAPGEVLQTRSRLDGRQVAARVVGVYRVDRASSVYWWANPLAVGATGPLVMTRRSFLALGFEDLELRWRLEPDVRGLTIDQAVSLRRKLATLPGRLNAGRPEGEQFALDTDLPEILAGAEQSLHRARAGVLVPSIQLMLLAFYGLVFTAGLLTERRLLTTESLRLRGATTSQVAGFALIEAGLIALPAVAVGPLVAAGSLHVLNHVGPLAAIGLRLDPQVSWAAYALAAGAGGVSVAGLVLPVVWARRAAVSRARRRLPLAGLAQRARLDLVLAALALLGYWQLRRYHGVLVEHRGGLGIDPFLVIAPALLMLAGALLSLRLVPLGALLVERFVASGRGAVAALGFWQLARRPRSYARSVLLLVLAVAIGVFAATYSRTWHQSQIDQAQYEAGADLLVEPSDRAGAPPAIDLASSYRALGAEDALPAVSDSFDLGRSGAESGNLLALDASRAAAVVHARKDSASSSLGELLRPLVSARGTLASLPLPGRPTRLALSVRLSISGPKVETHLAVARREQPSLFAYLGDGDGVLYLYRLRGLTPGRATRFELDLIHRLPGGRPAQPRYPLALAALEVDLDVPYLAPRRATLAVRSLEVARGPDARWQSVSLGLDRDWQASAVGFTFPYQLPRVEQVSAVGGSIRATVITGSSVDTFRRPTADFFLRPGRDSLPQAPPVLASDSLLAASDASVGQVVHLALSGGTHAVRIVGAFHRFPTLDPETPAAVADLPTYLALKLAVDRKVAQPAAWWLKTGRNGRIAEALRAPPFRSIDVVSRSERQHGLLEDPVPLGVIGALALGFVVAATFAAVGFAAGMAAAARSRMLEFAVLRAFGLRTRQLSGWISLESGLVLMLSLLGGTALGLLVSWLVLPYVALGTSGAPPVPPVRVAVPWATVLLLEAVLFGVLVALAAVQVGLVRRLRLAVALRSGEGALAR